MGALDKLTEALKLSKEKKDNLQSVMGIMMSQWQELTEANGRLSEETKHSLDSMMGLVMLHCHELEVQQNHTASCLSDCYKELAEPMAHNLAALDLRGKALAHGFDQLEEKEKQLNGLWSKVNEELKDFEMRKEVVCAASKCMEVWEAELKSKESEIEKRAQEMSTKEEELCVQDREAEWKIHDINRYVHVLNQKKEEIYDKECHLYAKQEEFEEWEDELFTRDMILDSMEVEHCFAEECLEQRMAELDVKEKQVRDLGRQLLCFSDGSPIRKRSRPEAALL